MLRREDGYVLGRELDLEAKGKRKKGRLKRTWDRQAGLRREDALRQSMWSYFFAQQIANTT